MSGPAAQHLPEALTELELRTRAGQPVALQMRALFECRRDQGSPVPGGVVDHEHHTRPWGRWLGPSAIPPVPRTARLSGVLPHPAMLGLCSSPPPLAHAGGEAPRHQGERTKDVHQSMAVQVTHHRPMPCAAQGRPHGWAHREARFSLTEQDQFPRLGFF
jgi:hypothetical protein